MSVVSGKIIPHYEMNIIDTNNVSEEEWKSFITHYNNSKDHLCVSKGKKEQDLFWELSFNYTIMKRKYHNFVIIYLYEEVGHNIVAFACLNLNHKEEYHIVTLALLCSSPNTNADSTRRSKRISKKSPRRNFGQSLGIYLLDYVFMNYIEPDNILLLSPANENLVTYYKKWKTPLLQDSYYSDDTSNTILMFGDPANITEKNALLLIPDLEKVDQLLYKFSPSIRDEYKTVEDKQQFLREKIKNSNYEDTYKDFLYGHLDTIKIFSYDQLIEYSKRNKDKHPSKKTYKYATSTSKKTKKNNRAYQSI